MAGPCTAWITGTEVLARPDLANVTIDQGVADQAADDASGILYALTGRQYPGACTATIRPFNPPVWCVGLASTLPHLVSQGVSIDSWLASTNGGACCPAGIDLGLYPVRSVTQVKVDGVVLSSSQYRLDDQRWLVRKATNLWPMWQRLDLDDTQPGTFSVTVSHGADPPAAGTSAASAFAAELAKMRAGLPNRLPQRVTNLTRQGVSMTVLDPQTYLKDGFTGLYDVDVFIRSVNPAKQTRRPTVWSPDMNQHRRG